jgi:uncharacterized membrane protein YjfL (UPF0719 family)
MKKTKMIAIAVSVVGIILIIAFEIMILYEKSIRPLAGWLLMSMLMFILAYTLVTIWCPEEGSDENKNKKDIQNNDLL